MRTLSISFALIFLLQVLTAHGIQVAEAAQKGTAKQAVPSHVAPAQKILFTQTTYIYFEKGIQFKSLEGLARAQLLLASLDNAVEKLKQRDALRLQKLSSKDYTALAFMLYPMQITTSVIMKNEQETLLAQVNVMAPLHASDAYMLQFLANPTQLMLCSYALATLTTLIHEAQQPAKLSKEHIRNINQIGHHADALMEYLQIVKNYTTLWENSPTSFATIKQLSAKAPNEPLITLALAELLLQNNLNTEALTAVNKTLEALPDMAHAYYIRGLINLNLQLPALANDDFDRAIKIQPENALFWRAMGTAHSMTSNQKAMCEALYQACTLGDCEALIYARKLNLCLTPQKNTQKKNIKKKNIKKKNIKKKSTPKKSTKKSNKKQ